MGKAKAVVIATGINTAIGEIHSHLSEQEDQKTPLKQKLDEFGDQLARAITVLCVLVWIVNIGHFRAVEHGGWLRGAVYYFKVAVALAVAAIPEGLSVIITTCLALGTNNMARKNAIVRSLPSVETLGCTSVICSDKTGTLTTAEMSVVAVYLENGTVPLFVRKLRTVANRFCVCALYLGAEYHVTGTSFAPNDGAVVGREFGIDQAAEPSLDLLSATCALCNSTSLSYDAVKGRFVPVGEATEAALRVLSEKLGTTDSLLNAEIQMKRASVSSKDASAVCDFYENVRFERCATLDFDRDRKSMSIVVRDRGSGELLLLVKGAPECILGRCTAASKGNEIAARTAQYGREALRTIAFAYKRLTDFPPTWLLEDPSQYSQYESGLTFLGLAAMMDPPRPEVVDSLKQCTAAGIRVIVLTGDNQATAEAIGKRVGLFAEDEEITAELSLTGAVFDALSEVDQVEALRYARLFSRVEPRHKSKLVRLLQQSGHVVAMTGDGVNDAPALKRADIGIAMGSGTDVAKAAADLVLVDDNFATIIEAVREGRAIYANTKQFIRYLISSNIGEVACVLGTALLGLPEVLSPVQLLWVNLVTDGLPATALGFNPHSPRSMKEAPRARDEQLVDAWLFVRYLIVGCYVGFATVAGFVLTLLPRRGAVPVWPIVLSSSTGIVDSRLGSSVALSVLVVIEMFNALNALSETESLLTLGPLTNPWLVGAIALSIFLHLGILYVEGLAKVFNVVPLSGADWILVLALSAPVVLIDEALKAISRRRLPLKAKKD